MSFALIFAPVAEAAACSNEAPAAATQPVFDDVAPSDSATVVFDSHGSAVPDVGDDLGLCQHGHCHHVAPYLPTFVAAVVAYPTVTSLAVKLRNQHPRSRAASRLERPPRA